MITHTTNHTTNHLIDSHVKLIPLHHYLIRFEDALPASIARGPPAMALL
jgi:hypothetical protein